MLSECRELSSGLDSSGMAIQSDSGRREPLHVPRFSPERSRLRSDLVICSMKCLVPCQGRTREWCVVVSENPISWRYCHSKGYSFQLMLVAYGLEYSVGDLGSGEFDTVSTASSRLS